jgi:hypothetical protein
MEKDLIYNQLKLLVGKHSHNLPFNYHFIKKPESTSQAILYSKIETEDETTLHKNLPSYKPIIVC